jgi:signal peptidase I
MSRKFRKAVWRDYFESILVAVFLALFVRSYVVTGYKVPTSSMSPTLLPGDFIFAYRLPFGFTLPLTTKKVFVQAPSRNEIVVFTFPEQPRSNYVKRVIGLPGDRVQIQNGMVIVNGEKTGVEAEKTGAKSFGPIIVPPGEVFLLGDNLEVSDDSRYWGTVPLEKIEGKVFYVWLSLDWDNRWLDGRLPSLRAGRSFTSVH